MYPALQGRHSVDACAELYSPATQSVHRVLADWLEKLPAPQGTHSLAPELGWI